MRTYNSYGFIKYKNIELWLPYSSYLKFIKKIKLVETCSVDGAENVITEERLYLSSSPSSIC